MIKRYDLKYSEYGACIGVKDNGKFCEYAEYEKIREQRDKLLEGLKWSLVRIRVNGYQPSETLFLSNMDKLIAECEGKDG